MYNKIFRLVIYNSCYSLNDLSIVIDDDIEIISIKLKLKNKAKPLIFTGLYRAYNSDTNFVNDLFYNLFFKYINTDIFICGDFNIYFIDIFNSHTSSFNHTLSQLGLLNTINIPNWLIILNN